MSEALPRLDARVFLIDMARCVGCQTCSIACKDRADLPDAQDWLRVERTEAGSYPQPTLAFRVVHCFHCAQPACAAACPTGAIAADDGGLVRIAYEHCIACGACTEACPFGAIILDGDGVPSKCDACADELAVGWQPTCVRACPMRALLLAAPDDLSRPRRPDPTWDDAGIGPRVYYAVRNAPPLGDSPHG